MTPNNQTAENTESAMQSTADMENVIKTMRTVNQRVQNIRKALTRDGSNINDVDRGFAMAVMDIMCSHGFTRPQIHEVIDEILDAINATGDLEEQAEEDRNA